MTSVQRLTMKDFDPSKLREIWYEIAHIGSPFHVFGLDYANAIVRIWKDPRGDPSKWSITINYYKDVVVSTLHGVLWTPDPNSPSKFKVKFGKWHPTKSYDFWFYDTDYTGYAVIGSPDGNAWVLCGEPQMSYCKFKPIQLKLGSLGFATTKLESDHDSLRACTKAEAS